MADFAQFGLDLLGVLIGVWVAFRLDRFQESRNKIDENIRVLELLGRELELDLSIIRANIRANLEKLKIPYAHLELAIWNASPTRLTLSRMVMLWKLLQRRTISSTRWRKPWKP